MTTNGNNLEPEFDALLAAHIKQRGAAQSAVCEQFAPDTASAYLEQALTQNALTAYEAHLADCVSCRRQITALARLMPAPSVAIENVGMAERPSLKQRMSEWFTGWRLGAVAGLGAVAATVLLVAVVVQRSPQESIVALRAPDSTKLSQASSTPVPSSEAELDKFASTASPTATPASLPRGKAMAEATPAAPASAPPASVASEAAPPPPPAPKPAPEARKEPAAADLAAPSNQARNIQNLTPSGPAVGQNQIQTERQLERSKREESAARPQEKAAERVQKLDDQVADTRRDEAPEKNAADAEAPRKDARAKASSRTPSAMVPARPARIVAGKSFRLEAGIWTDTEYEAGKGLPVVRLQPNSETYKQTLQDVPGLKPYFELHSVLVVWQGKVYRVEK